MANSNSGACPPTWRWEILTPWAGCPEDVEVVRHPVRKDDTDMMLAVQEGLARGCGRFLIYGGLGGRLDHTLANLHILAFLARKHIPAFLLGPDAAITAVCNGTLSFPAGYRAPSLSPGAGRRRTSPSPACSTPWTTARW